MSLELCAQSIARIEAVLKPPISALLCVFSQRRGISSITLLSFLEEKAGLNFLTLSPVLVLLKTHIASFSVIAYLARKSLIATSSSISGFRNGINHISLRRSIKNQFFFPMGGILLISLIYTAVFFCIV